MTSALVPNHRRRTWESGVDHVWVRDERDVQLEEVTGVLVICSAPNPWPRAAGPTLDSHFAHWVAVLEGQVAGDDHPAAYRLTWRYPRRHDERARSREKAHTFLISHGAVSQICCAGDHLLVDAVA